LHRTITTAILAAAALASGPLACDDDARPLADEPVYGADVRAILGAKCASCHAGDAPAAGYRVDTWQNAIACTADGRAAVLPGAGGGPAPILQVLASRDDHRALLTEAERATLTRWVEAGAPSTRPGVHPARFADPRSGEGHVAALRAARHRPLFDANDRDACARCHEGAGARPPGVTTAAPGATACTTCHAEPGGILACTTCHGAKGRAYPPRDACFFPGDAKADAHAAHAGVTRSRAQPLSCATCHPRTESGAFVGTHGDGHVEVWFGTIAGAGASFDPASKKCTGTCHDKGGARPGPTWASGGAPLGCNDCHASPPAAHYPGACNACHREANAAGTALASPALHANGKVDLGDGSGLCGACHGTGDSPWPTTGAHAAHAAPKSGKPVACDTCHDVPGPGEPHPTRATGVTVRLAGLATKGGSRAVWDAATKSCAATYCHDQSGGTARAPKWRDGAAASGCASCHASPPPAPHSAATSCSGATCHDGSTTGSAPGLAMTPAGRAAHVDGVIDRRVQ